MTGYAASPAVVGSGFGRALLRRSRTAGAPQLLVLILLWAALSIATPAFLTPGNVFNLLLAVSQIAIIAAAMAAVLITGGIDVSVGAALAVCAVVVGQAAAAGAPLVVCLALGIFVGAATGTTNALLITGLGLHPIIVTLATMNLFRMVALLMANGEWITNLPPVLRPISTANVFGIPAAAIVALVVAVVAGSVLAFHRRGRHLYAIGANPDAARLSGISVGATTFACYVAVGICVGIASAVYVGGQGVVQANVGLGLELQVIAACVLGGVSVLGGSGSVFGAVVGAMLIGTVRNGLVLLGVPALAEGLVVGALVLVAAGTDILISRRKKA